MRGQSKVAAASAHIHTLCRLIYWHPMIVDKMQDSGGSGLDSGAQLLACS